MQDIKLNIRDLLKNNWNSANTNGITPKISTGGYREESEYTQVSVRYPDEDEGSRGLKSDGTVVQNINGTLQIDTWVTWPAAKSQGTNSPNPKQVNFNFAEEIKRIIRANRESITDIENILWFGRRELTETDRDPVVFRYVTMLGYYYKEGV